MEDGVAAYFKWKSPPVWYGKDFPSPEEQKRNWKKLMEQVERERLQADKEFLQQLQQFLARRRKW